LLDVRLELKNGLFHMVEEESSREFARAFEGFFTQKKTEAGVFALISRNTMMHTRL